jgi:nucleotide-binding universal stress UspA family protein
MTIIGNQIAVTLDTILFATDFSSSAETAKMYVQSLAERYQSKVRVMHVVDLVAAFKTSDAGVSIDFFRRLGEESLGRLTKELDSEHTRAEAVLCEGADPATEILRAAEDSLVNPLVIGTRGHKGLARVVLGSTAEELIHQAGCPILAIGPAVSPPKLPINFQKIVYATDFSPEAAKACVFALSFAQDFGAHLLVSCGARRRWPEERSGIERRVCQRPAAIGPRCSARMVRTGMCSGAWLCGGRHTVARRAGKGRSDCAGNAQNITLVRQFQIRGGVPGD